MRRAIKEVRRRSSGQRIARVLVFLLILSVLILWLVPWQQTIIGGGQVAVFNPAERPQTIEAQIPGRIVKWNVSEGQLVGAGDIIAEIEDIDQKFLDPEIEKRMTGQQDALTQSQSSETSRIARITSQIGEVQSSKVQQLKNANERIRQAQNRLKAAKAAQAQSEQNLKAFVKVAKASAEQRKLQAQDIVRQNDQLLITARQQFEVEKKNFERVAYLASKGLESKRNFELAEASQVAAEARVKQLEETVAAAKRTVELGTLGQDQAEIDIARQREAVTQAKEGVLAADRDVSIAKNDLVRIENDASATIASLEASLQSAESTRAKATSDLEKIKLESANVTGRRRQAQIKAPASGRLINIARFGAGSMVKAGDVLATIAPETKDRIVEMLVTDNDVRFISIGRPVRLQFAGYPAVQFSGAPGVSVGTYGGRVQFIDPVDDGSSRFRVLVKEARFVLPGGKKDQPWPPANNLRPGAEAIGWIMLDTVPLGFELWRQFNNFPPRIPKGDPLLGKANKKESTDQKQKVDKEDKADYLSPTIKVKAKR
ncbi:MAG: HlyD family efflux transporter periplasmic adaptor subunit [Armatimonadota bacterium]